MLFRSGPTSANSQPARFLFLRSAEAKAKLKPCLAESNVEKTMTAPVTVIVASDPKFYDQLPKQFPHTDARSWFVGNEDLIQQTAFRNSSLQGAYFMLAARALGLDCGPMSGFDPKKVNEAFFAKSQFQANFICNLGYGDNQKLFPRSPRLNFSEACQVL